MKRTFPLLAGLGALLIALPGFAQEPQPATSEVCKIEPPRVPTVDWHGVATYRAHSTVKDGHVVAVRIEPVQGSVERLAQRSLIQSIEQSLRVAQCQPGEHVFEKDFSFDLSQAPAPAKADRNS